MQCTGNSGCFPRGKASSQMDMGSLTCAQMWVRYVHAEGGQAQTSLRKSWLGGTEKLFLTLPHQGIEPRFFGFEFRLSNHWATSPVRACTSCWYSALPNVYRSANGRRALFWQTFAEVSRINAGCCFKRMAEFWAGKQVVHLAHAKGWIYCCYVSGSVSHGRNGVHILDIDAFDKATNRGK